VTDDLLAVADRLWRGDADISEFHPFRFFGGAAEVAEDTLFVASFANVSAIATGDGLVMVDTGSQFLCGQVRDTVRGWRSDRLNTAVYSHGHIDHVFGVDLYEAEARGAAFPAPVVVAHARVPARFDRYKLTAGYNGVINQRQFGIPGLAWPTDYRYPDRVYEDGLSMEVGGEVFELHHSLGETDDHTWTWVPARKLLCCGDFFIWASPNCGNPQKVQRYPRQWAIALREMAAVGAETLLPGHGLPILGTARVATALTDAAALLESLHDQTVAMMNAGATLDEIIHTVRAPQELLDKPYLHAVYDEPEFVVRNVWRLYGGWYDGNPAHLKPAPDGELAAEVARLAGGADRLARRASELAAEGRLRLAGHLAQMAADAAPSDAEIAAARREVFAARADAEASTMSQGVFRWAAGAPDAG
jgi:alkyl sulfatase BDS1-like metallo-beta-lactamase superfamily hydrolase